MALVGRDLQDSISYELGEDKYADAQVNDPYVKAFVSRAQVHPSDRTKCPKSSTTIT